MSDIPIDDEIVVVGDERFLPHDEDEGDLSDAYMITDTAETDLADGDYVPFYDTSAGAKKKSLWSNIVAKIKAALGIASSGTTFLRKDGTWATPTNTTYTFATGDSNGQIKVTPSGGTAQNVSVKGLKSAAYIESTSFAVSNFLTNQNLNDVKTPGFYNAAGDNTCTNTGLTSGTAFGLQVVHTAGGSYYYQIINPLGSNNFYRRVCSNGTWGAWTLDRYTWRGIQNNLTSDSTTDSLSAAQGKVLKDSKVAKSGDTMTGILNVPYVKCIRSGYSYTTVFNGQNQSDTTTKAMSQIALGNDTATGTTGNSAGELLLYSGTKYYINLRAQDVTASRTLYLPASGTALATSASSSYRVKENIRDMTEEEAGKILDVNVVKFDYKEEYDDGGIDQSGVIAEEVLDIIPEVVNISKLYDETKAIDPASNPSPTVDYGKFTPYLIKMVQMQQERIDRLESMVEELRR